MNAIEISNLSFGYDKKDLVLDDISFNIEEFSTTAVLGKNGSGKSTLLKILTGLEHHSSGNVLLKGKPISEYSILERSKQIAYVGQDIFNQFDFSVEDYLLFGVTNSLSLISAPKQRHKEKVYEYVSRFEIKHLLEKKMDKISGGEKQIIMLCKAFIQGSDIVVLDEPLSALDFENQNKILNLLKNISNKGKTIIFSTHNPNNALFLDANTIMLSSKKIVFNGKARKDLTIEALNAVYGNIVGKSSEHPYDEFSVKSDEI